MKTGKRTRRAFAGGIGAALAATAAKGSAQINPQASVAVVCPLSGPESQAGTQLANGVRGALDDANGTRGLFDRFWSLRTFDDQGTMAQALLEAQFAINDLNQSAAIGHETANNLYARRRKVREWQGRHRPPRRKRDCRKSTSRH